jgi:hypothetical protein
VKFSAGTAKVLWEIISRFKDVGLTGRPKYWKLVRFYGVGVVVVVILYLTRGFWDP